MICTFRSSSISIAIMTFFLCTLVARTTTTTTSRRSVSTAVTAFSAVVQTSPRAAAAAAAARSSISSSTNLRASFLDDLTKAFSTMTSGTSSASSSSSKFYTIGITGASGLVGTALQDELLSKTTTTLKGKPVRTVQLKRGSSPSRAADLDLENDDRTTLTAIWNPQATEPSNVMDPKLVEQFDAVIHLSGENISTGLTGTPLAFLGIRPWTDSKKQEIIESRTKTTAALAGAIARCSKTTKKIDFIVSSGIGVYGSDFIEGRSEQVNSPPDESANVETTLGFLAEVSRQWEAAAQPALESGGRVVNMRTAVVMSTKGGALAKLYPIFYLGGGGIVGSGKQYFPYISARDMARAVVHILNTPSLEGPINMIAPDAGCTNADFTRAMGRVMGRPTVLPLPAFVVSLLFGEMGEEVLLGGTRARPQKLLDSGFQFLHPTVEDALRSAIVEEKKI